MALTKETIEDKIEVAGNYKSVQIRTATVVKEDGVELSKSFSRKVLQCSTKTDGTWGDTDISEESAEVQGICNAVWTDAVKTAYQTQMDTQESEITPSEE